jgi:hypothetical protein
VTGDAPRTMPQAHLVGELESLTVSSAHIEGVEGPGAGKASAGTHAGRRGLVKTAAQDRLGVACRSAVGKVTHRPGPCGLWGKEASRLPLGHLNGFDLTDGHGTPSFHHDEPLPDLQSRHDYLGCKKVQFCVMWLPEARSIIELEHDAEVVDGFVVAIIAAYDRGGSVRRPGWRGRSTAF